MALVYDPSPPNEMGWPLGQRNSDPIFKMLPGSLVLSRNADIWPDGALGIRRAVKTVGARVSETGLVGIGGLGTYQDDASSIREVVLVGGTKWYKWDATDEAKTVTAISGGSGYTDGLRWSLVRWRTGGNNWLIGGNGTDAVQAYDGSTVATLASKLPAGSTLTAVSEKYKYLTAWGEFLWGATANSNALRFSTFQTPYSFPAAQTFYINDLAGGGITAIGGADDALLFSTRRATYVIQGESRRNLGIVRRMPSVGCCSHDTMVNTPAGLQWMDDDGVWRWTGDSVEWVSGPIADVFRALDFTKLTQARGGVYKNPLTKQHHYILAVTEQGGVTGGTWLVQNLNTGGWGVHTDLQALALTTGHDAYDMQQLYTVDAETTIRLNDQDENDRTPVSFMLIDRPRHFDVPHLVKSLQRVFVFYQADSAADLRVRVTADFRVRQWPASGDYTVALTGDKTPPDQYSQDQPPVVKHFLQRSQGRMAILRPSGLKGHSFQLRIQNRDAGRSFRILGVVYEAELDTGVDAS